MRNLIIFGAQGSGKGTQAHLLQERLGLVYIGLGRLYRQYASEPTSFGQQIKEIIDKGNLVPDEITDQVVAQKIGDLPPEVCFILDGYPRNLNQSKALHRTLQSQERILPPPIVLNLLVPQDELLRRLRKRRDIEGRDDDSDEGIARRLEIYKHDTEPLLDDMRTWAEVIDVDGHQSIAEVAAEIKDKLDAHVK